MTYKFGTNFGRIGTARSANLQAYYKFDGDIDDSSGNNLDLTVAAGAMQYCYIDNLQMARFDGATSVFRSSGGSANTDGVNDASLTITGAMTFHLLLAPEVVTSGTGASSDWVFNFTGPGGDDEEDNVLYSLAIDSSKWSYFVESGSGDNYWVYFDGPIPYSVTRPTTTPVLMTVTRDASGSLTIYTNGRVFPPGTITTEQTAGGPSPTGGTDGFLVVGAAPYTGSQPRYFTGAMAELQILNIELTAAQVLEDARKVMPWL